jgi:hypothetical protein
MHYVLIWAWLDRIFNLLFFAPGLNEELVQLLLIRDELHTEQDAMLVDIEDLTRSVCLPPSKGEKKPWVV